MKKKNMQKMLLHLKKYWPWVLIMGIIIVAVLISFYFYRQSQDAKYEAQLAKNNPAAGDKELESTIEKVGKIVLLPTGETPTLATVTDKERLSNQDFYENARNGDKVLIYASARKAFLYRPSTGQIIAIAPVTVDPKTASSSATR